MAGISVGGHGGKKSVDSEIPLVPFIDLLLCCIMFLLATAVWNQLAQLDANQQQPGQPNPDQPIPDEIPERLVLQVQRERLVLGMVPGEVEQSIDKVNDAYDLEALVEHLERFQRQLARDQADKISVAPEDGVRYEEVIQVMDKVIQSGFENLSVTDVSAL